MLGTSSKASACGAALGHGVGDSALRQSRVWAASLALISMTVLWFALLGNRALYDPDEGRYAEIPREMLQQGDWVIPHLDGLVYLEKPPLQYWLTALSFRCFGESDVSARLCTGLAGYLSLLIVFFMGRRLWGGAAGVRAVLLTGASTLFVLLGHQLTLDMLLSFWLLASLACFLMAQLERDRGSRSGAWMLGSWAAMALAVLTKGLIGVLVPGATLVLYGLWQGDRGVLRALNLRWGLPLFAAIVAPWFVLAAKADPNFLQFFFVRQHFQRFLTPIDHRSKPWWFFILVLGVGILPWIPQVLDAAVSGRGEPRGRFDPARVLWAWSAFVFLFFSLSDSKLIPYVLPVVPALALICARPSARDATSLRVGALMSVAASGGIVAYAGGVWSSGTGALLPQQMQIGLSLAAGSLAASAILCLILLLHSATHKALIALCVGWFLGSSSLLIAGAEVQKVFSAKEVADALRSIVPATATLYSVQDYDQSLPFYLKRTLMLVDYRDELALGLDENPSLGIPDLAHFSERWRGSSEGFAVMPLPTLEALTAQGLPMREIARVHDRVIVSRR